MVVLRIEPETSKPQAWKTFAETSCCLPCSTYWFLNTQRTSWENVHLGTAFSLTIHSVSISVPGTETLYLTLPLFEESVSSHLWATANSRVSMERRVGDPIAWNDSSVPRGIKEKTFWTCRTRHSGLSFYPWATNIFNSIPITFFFLA